MRVKSEDETGRGGQFRLPFTPIEETYLAYTRQTMQAHGAWLLKIRPEDSDCWWTIFLPEGSTKVKREARGEVPYYTICLPDGYRFDFEAGILDRWGRFTTDPVIFLNPPSDPKKGDLFSESL